MEQQRRRYRGFYRTPSPSRRETQPKNRPFLPPTLPVDQTRNQRGPIAGPSGIRLPGIRQMPIPRVPMPQAAVPHAQAPQIRPPAPQVQPAAQAPVRPPAPSLPPRPRQDPLQKANEAWKQAGNFDIV